MLVFAIIIAGRYGYQPNGGPAMAWVMLAILAVIAFIAAVNWKKLNNVNRDAEGRKSPPQMSGKTWKCQKCGETSEAQSQSCYYCGAARPK